RPWFFRPRPAPRRSWDRKAVAFLRLSCRLPLSATLQLGRTALVGLAADRGEPEAFTHPLNQRFLMRSLPGPNRPHSYPLDRVTRLGRSVLERIITEAFIDAIRRSSPDGPNSRRRRASATGWPPSRHRAVTETRSRLKRALYQETVSLPSRISYPCSR